MGSGLLDDIFGGNEEDAFEIIGAPQKELPVEKETEINLPEIKLDLSDLKNKYKKIKVENTKDYDEIRDEIKDLKTCNHKLLKDLMIMMEGNVQPQVLKSYSEIINSTVKLNQFILEIDDKRKRNVEEIVYEEMAEQDGTEDINETPVFKLNPSQLFGEVLDDIKELVLEQTKKKEQEIQYEEIEIVR